MSPLNDAEFPELGEAGNVPIVDRASSGELPDAGVFFGFEPDEPADLVPNRADITRHLYALFQPAFAQAWPDARIEIAWSHPGDGELDKAETFSVFALEQAVAFAERQNRAGFNVYVGAALRKAGTIGRANGAAVVTASHAWNDFDDRGDLDRVDTALQEKDLQTSMTVVTGTVPHIRFQPYFQFAEPPDCEQLRAANIGLRELLGGDRVQNPDRVLRLAGTVSYPTREKVARGYIPELTTLHLRRNTPAYCAAYLIGLAGAPPELPPSAPAELASDARRQAYGQAALDRIAGELGSIPEGDHRNNGAYSAGLHAGSLIAGGCLGEATEIHARLVQAAQQGWGKPTDRAYGPKGAILRGIRDGMQHPRGPRDYDEWAAKVDLEPFLEKARGAAMAEAQAKAAGASSPADDAWDPWHEAPVPRLDMALLPAIVRQAAETSARVSGADVDAFAIGYLVGLTACGDARLQITPKQHATDWSVPLLLWVILIAPPASMKSEVIKKARAMAASLDAQERERYGREVAIAESEAGLRAGTEKLSKADQKQMRIDARQSVPPPRQRICQDVTIEKYVEILSVNPGGCGSFREEMAGWLGALGRYSANGSDGSDRAFYCALRDGSPYTRQIKSAKDIHLEHCAGSFLAAVQADRLRDFKLPMADGLFQRFMPLMMREASGYQDSSDADDAKGLLRPARDRLMALAPEMETDAYGQAVARPFKLSAEGGRLYAKFANDMRIAARAREPSIEFGDYLQKLGPMWLSLALLFHLVETDETRKPWTGAFSVVPPQVVPTAIAQRADALMRGFFIPHAEHFYDLISGGGRGHRLRSVASAILRCPKAEIVLRDVVRRCHAMQGKEQDRNEHIRLMQQFEVFGWLTRLDRFGTAHPRWMRTPGLHERFEKDLEREVAVRAAMTEAIKADASARKAARGG